MQLIFNICLEWSRRGLLLVAMAPFTTVAQTAASQEVLPKIPSEFNFTIDTHATGQPAGFKLVESSGATIYAIGADLSVQVAPRKGEVGWRETLQNLYIDPYLFRKGATEPYNEVLPGGRVVRVVEPPTDEESATARYAGQDYARLALAGLLFEKMKESGRPEYLLNSYLWAASVTDDMLIATVKSFLSRPEFSEAVKNEANAKKSDFLLSEYRAWKLRDPGVPGDMPPAPSFVPMQPQPGAARRPGDPLRGTTENYVYKIRLDAKWNELQDIRYTLHAPDGLAFCVIQVNELSLSMGEWQVLAVNPTTAVIRVKVAGSYAFFDQWGSWVDLEILAAAGNPATSECAGKVDGPVAGGNGLFEERMQGTLPGTSVIGVICRRYRRNPDGTKNYIENWRPCGAGVDYSFP